jgi:hypothetical protein
MEFIKLKGQVIQAYDSNDVWELTEVKTPDPEPETKAKPKRGRPRKRKYSELLIDTSYHVDEGPL